MTNQSHGLKAWAVGAVLCFAVLELGVQTATVARVGILMPDFHAFYCAGRVASEGKNPYHTEPLRSCERALGPKRFFDRNPGLTIPAPLPGYAIALLAPFGRMPYQAAAVCWFALSLCAVAVCIFSTARFAQVSWDVSLAAFVLALAALSLPYGEIVPLALAFICLAAYFAWRGHYSAMAICTGAAMIEPHVGLPACVAAAIWFPRSRAVLASSLGLLGTISLVAIGPTASIEYVTAVLPAHALTELTQENQYSLTTVLVTLGAPVQSALRAGGLWYLAMCVLGVLVGGLAAKRTGNRAYVICAGPAVVVFGGSFVHLTQIAVALPAALLLVSTSTGELRVLSFAALLLLSIPWWVASPVLLLAPVMPSALLTWRCWRPKATVAAGAALATLAMAVALVAFKGMAGLHVMARVVAVSIDPTLAEASWQAYTQRVSTSSFADWAIRAPTWIGLGLLLSALVATGDLFRLGHAQGTRESQA